MASGMVYDVIVIGAGIEGSSTAYSLAKKGQNVLLLEQFPLPHSRGSSHGHSRITRYAYEEDFYVRMMVDAFPLWAELEKEVGEKFFINCGTLDVRMPGTPGERRVVESMAMHKAPHEVLTSAQMTHKFPAVAAPGGCGAVFDPSGGILRADKCLVAFQTMFKRLGGTIRDSEPVTSLKPGNIVTVTTSQADYQARNVVIATGPWTAKFVSNLNIDIPLKPIRISVFYWKVDPAKLALHTPERMPCLIDSRGAESGVFDVYSLPVDEYPGCIKVALHNGPDIHPDSRDSPDSSWVLDSVRGRVAELFPYLDTSQPVLSEACIYTNSPDHHPVIDRHPHFSNIIICAGFSGHGFKLSPAVGKAVTELVLQENLTYNMQPFRIDRFSTKSKL